MALTDPVLLAQWDRERNGDLTPDDVTYGSRRKVWWRCEKGHSWQAQIKSRTLLGAGCPICSNRAVASGVNDLATLRPDLAAQWDPERNLPLTPERIAPGSHKRVWWRCEKGHAWQAMPAARSAGESCPVCAGKVVVPGENDLATLYPEIAAQWDGEKNGRLTAKEVSPYSNRKAWWRCREGHSWQAAIAARTKRKTGCPYCTGRKVLAGYNDLATVEPFVAMQWHPALNGDLTPEQVTGGSRRYVWWQCSLGHVWKARVHSRTGNQRCGCPVCAGRTKAASRDPPVLAS